MTYLLIGHAWAGAPVTATTTGFDTTGANLIVVGASTDTSPAGGTLSDSNGNTWTLAISRVYNAATNFCSAIYYCYNPIVGAGHTFTYSGASQFPEISVQAWSGAAPTPLDQTAWAESTLTTYTYSPAITPSADNELVVTHGFETNSPALSVNGNYTTTDSQAIVGGTYFGGTLAYQVQGLAAATAPLWTNPAGGTSVSTLATFFASVAAVGPTLIPTLQGFRTIARRHADRLASLLPIGPPPPVIMGSTLPFMGVG